MKTRKTIFALVILALAVLPLTPARAQGSTVLDVEGTTTAHAAATLAVMEGR
jgi:hypothetical protein